MTASDARPPSDTGATGWHEHPSGSVCEADKCHWPDVEHLGRPVLVVDPAEARETIARTLLAALMDEYGADEETWTALRSLSRVTTRVLAALAGRGQP